MSLLTPGIKSKSRGRLFDMALTSPKCILATTSQSPLARYFFISFFAPHAGIHAPHAEIHAPHAEIHAPHAGIHAQSPIFNLRFTLYNKHCVFVCVHTYSSISFTRLSDKSVILLILFKLLDISNLFFEISSRCSQVVSK